MGASILGFGRVVANPDITPILELLPDWRSLARNMNSWGFSVWIGQ